MVPIKIRKILILKTQKWVERMVTRERKSIPRKEGVPKKTQRTDLGSETRKSPTQILPMTQRGRSQEEDERNLIYQLKWGAMAVIHWGPGMLKKSLMKGQSNQN